MKTIDEIIKKASPDKLKEISGIMEIRGGSEQKIRDSYMNILALARLLAMLTRDELSILRFLYSDNDGVSFSDIQKALNVNIDTIESATNTLSGYMLAYVLKNRQMLNKKMDKLYCISEIAEIFSIKDSQDITEHLHKIEETLAEKKIPEQPPKADDRLKAIFKKIIEKGGIIPIPEIIEEFKSQEYEQKASEAFRSGMLVSFNLAGDNIRTYLSLDPSLAPWAATLNKKGNIPATHNIDNGYNLAVNLLLAYDVISSSGLFLTKQNKFRKIDLKKISDAMLPLKFINGDTVQGEDAAMMILQLLNIMNCLKLDRDIGVISLKPVADVIDDPVLLLRHIATKMTDQKKRDDVFSGGINIPDHHDLKTAVSIIGRVKSAELNYMKSAFMTARLAVLMKKNGTLIPEQVKADGENFSVCLDFLTLCGITAVVEGNIVLTEPGRRLHSALFGKKYAAKEIEPSKCIYISPDFTLMIPDREIDPSALYLIMAYTETLKQDVVIEAAITKSSIINASKRGMNFDRFIATLRKYAKNEIPQNLEYLLVEWAKQTISINISRPVLLYSSHPSYIDELLYSSTSRAVKSRISENYVILDRDHIDDVVRFSKKFDVRLNIFEDEN